MASQRATADSVYELSNLRVEGDTFDVTGHLASDCSVRFLDEAKARFRSMFVKALVAPLYTGLTYLMVAATLLVFVRFDGLEMVSLGPIFLIVLRSLGYGQGLQQAGSTLSTLNPLLETIRDAGSRLESSKRRRGNKELGEVNVVELKDVSFAYEGSTVSNIEKVSLEVRRGDRVGVVGASGSGKSTLVRLLLGVLEPSSGQVLINGTPLEDLRTADRCQRITYVPQKVGILTGAITENVRFRRESILAEDISWSLEMSDLAGEVAGLEDGGGTLLTNSRDRLSGGQIQRLGIARALAGHPDVVIMDEPTSSVDRASERAIVNSLRSLPTSTTLVLVSHRLELLRDCSTLVVMESGRVTASGRPSELFSTNEYLRGLEFNA
jgi:ABC-type multidrug transport system fused ATPase/permease subunit